MDKRTLNVISLCAGGGGLDLGLELALGCTRTVCWLEWNAFAIEFLATRMEEKILDEAPLWTDLRTFDGKPWRGKVDCITGGYPCQPFSLAGKRLGQDDPRHLWPQVARIAREVKPWMLFLENVSGHTSLGYDAVEEELHEMGYTTTPGLFTAEEIGSTHRRERLFILALANASYQPGDEQQEFRFGAMGAVQEFREFSSGSGQWSVADKGGSGEVSGTKEVAPFPPSPIDDWNGIPVYLQPATQPFVCSVVDGLADDRAAYLKILGNGVVPLEAAYAFLSLWSVARLDLLERAS